MNQVQSANTFLSIFLDWSLFISVMVYGRVYYSTAGGLKAHFNRNLVVMIIIPMVCTLHLAEAK